VGDKGESASTSFGSVAASYDRLRPGPAPAAVNWLLPERCTVVVDLAAGTGLLTRALRDRAGQVIAIEPDERMRGVLAARSAGVHVLNGRAEAIPLPDGCADAVLVSHAWHWFDPKRAVPEIARVLTDGGRLGVLWTSRDRGVDWVADLDVIGAPEKPRTRDEAMERMSRLHSVTIPAGAPFGAAVTASFEFARKMSVDDTLDWPATASQVITADPPECTAGLARARAVLEGHAIRAGDTELIRIPMRSWCWRADRLPRPRLSSAKDLRALATHNSALTGKQASSGKQSADADKGSDCHGWRSGAAARGYAERVR
jgi:ubiquinone/menaquinone biosynthesis C-methylase UbiE